MPIAFIARCIGSELVADCRAAVIAVQQLPLPIQRRSPGPAPPAVACIQVDGGRIQLRPRAAEPHSADSWWRETKVSCLLAMTSEMHVEDPTPHLPETLIDPAQMAEISREIKAFLGAAEPLEPAPEAVERVPLRK